MNAQRLISKLASTNNYAFYTTILAHCVLEVDKKLPAPAGMCFRNGRFRIVFNPKLIAKYSANEQVGILVHELKHITYKHWERMDQFTDKKLFNTAADLAINPSIPELKSIKDIMWPEAFNLPEGQTVEYYYSKLKEMGFEGDNGFDEHGDCDDARSASREANRLVHRASIAVGSKNAPEEVRIGSGSSKVCWRQILKRFVSTVRTNENRLTRAKRNRRFGLKMPVHVPVNKPKLCLALDVSGSMLGNLDDFYAEIRKLVDLVDVRLITFDTEVIAEHDLTKGFDIKVEGGGGTLYKPVLDYAIKENYNGLIILGDMDCYDREDLPRYGGSLLWVHQGQGRPADFGWEITI